MVVYSIKELSLLSGIKAHTIRIWEKRYNVFSPNRTDTNIRRYSEDDLKLALNISLLLKMGYKISHVARMSNDEIRKTVEEGNKYVKPPSVPEAFFVSAMNFDRESFSKKIDETIEEKGMEWTFENLIVPFQRRMGLLWQSGTITPAQEHFASNIVREKLITQTEKLPSPKIDASKILFFLPEGDLHEIGILYFAYHAKKEGLHTIYLGQGVPLSDITEIGTNHNVSNFFVSIINPLPEEELAALFKQLLNSFPKASILATGYQVELNNKIIPKQVVRISSAKEFVKVINSRMKL
ncbi:MAG TPA: MerR family transcriptional regulator [Tenuifilaceae bacterium]|nr:MerR family transcriptional regulator [Tenuifilaceae bacterium]HPE18071.1 MerR family transcriptional regulator [Tenuifilaceae bacterium]HPJ45441.1 MerR family transcriptional regulator [Tenuifilaceae bacterium]HPQ34058.1 MerR family transcriptional regulator [Tenuifilaceae bacterium]HRX69244.1 MerR family transcriptional regulator [Tenuifilaceae bacterium]